MWLYTKLDQADVAIQQFVMYEQFVWDEFAGQTKRQNAITPTSDR